jgi:hypothetical protein
VSQKGSSRAWEVESITVLASVRGDAEVLIRKVALLDGELMNTHWSWEKAKEKVHSLSCSSAVGTRWLVSSEMEHQEQFVELSLVRAWGTGLCLTILGPSAEKRPLTMRMWATTLRHTRVVEELTVLRVDVSSTTELMLGRSPGKASQVEVMNELTAKF